ncbi:hypothetical protein NLJ89_g7737 [Agrocybe chaxingu]|uniref:Beta-lactamase-related domain-containing protein n=1 Tax=Agrocybe chaxingu TaxID=84603 RepID=A0A9W8JWK5_9AGAR|nr:hypothetical protein NLJ89_g7737 [Agrocybe chaxingu]
MVHLSEKGKAALDSILAKAIDDGRVPGAGLVVGTVDREIYSGAAGLRSFQDPSAGKVDADSIFWICSQTKLITTTAILQLVGRGLLGYDTPVALIIPELANPIVITDPSSPSSTYAPAKTPILLRHLLNHTSGLYYPPHKRSSEDLAPANTRGPYEGDHSVAQFFRILRSGLAVFGEEYRREKVPEDGLPGVPLAYEPGTNFSYGWSCDILVFMVERLTGQKMEDYCKEHIFGPLGMETSFYLTPEKKAKLVQLTYRRCDGTLEKWADQIDIIEQDPTKLDIVLGGIGLYSTLNDYLKLLQHIISIKAETTTKGILSAKSVSDLFNPTLPEHATAALYQFTKWDDCQFGIGLCLATKDWSNGRRKKGSGFWYGWAGTYYFMDPSTGIAVAYGTQVAPTNDREVVKLWEELETAIYQGLEA